MNFILVGHGVLCLKASPARSKIRGIRFFHVGSGEIDLTKVSARWGILSECLSMKTKARTVDAPTIRNFRGVVGRSF